MDISNRYGSLAHGFMNGCGNVTYYALSGSLIGQFLQAGKCELSVPVPDNDWVGMINGTMGPVGECTGESGEVWCIAEKCADAMDSCMKDDAELMIAAKMEGSLVTLTTCSSPPAPAIAATTM